MELSKTIVWSDHLEDYFKSIGEKSYTYALLHKQAEKKYTQRKVYIELPVIVLTSLSGTLSISSSSLFENAEKTASVFIGFLSIFCGILNTVNTYFSYAKRAEGHRISNIEYNKLYRFLEIELKLPRHERMQPSDLLKKTRDDYERLNEISPLIDMEIIEKLKEKFKDYNVHKPSEMNGLEEIVVYRPPQDLPEPIEEEKDMSEVEKMINDSHQEINGLLKLSE